MVLDQPLDETAPEVAHLLGFREDLKQFEDALELVFRRLGRRRQSFCEVLDREETLARVVRTHFVQVLVKHVLVLLLYVRVLLTKQLHVGLFVMHQRHEVVIVVHCALVSVPVELGPAVEVFKDLRCADCLKNLRLKQRQDV